MKKVILTILMVIVVLGATISPFGASVASADALNTASNAIETGTNYLTSGLFGILGGITGITTTVPNVILNMLLIPAAGTINDIVGRVLEMAINFSVDTQTFTNNLPVLESGWSIIRDICNMFFIFIIIYTAFTLILGIGSGKTYGIITDVIITALLVNFSLYISQLIIDAGNIFASGFNDAIHTLIKNFIGTSGTGQSYTISNAVNIATSMQRFYETQTVGSYVGETIFLNSILRLVLICTSIYVFFKVVILFVARTVAFMFLMVTAPIGFVGHLMGKKFSDYQGKWWSTLFDQTLMAPIFLLFMYIILRFMTSAAFITSDIMSAGAKIEGSGMFNIGNYFKFFLIIGMFLAALKITKELSGEAGNIATDLGKKGLVAAGGFMAGGAAIAGRNVVGRFGKMIAENETIKNAASSGSGFSRVFHKAGIAAQSGSFDIRSGLTGSLISKTGLNIGKTSGEGGFKKELEESTKPKIEYAKTLGSSANKQNYATSLKTGIFGLTSSNQEAAKKIEKSLKTDQEELDKIRGENEKKIENALSSGDIITVQNTINSMKGGDIGKLKSSILTDAHIIGMLQPKMLAAIKSNGHLTSGEENIIATAIRNNPAHPSYNYISAGPGQHIW